jgi:hypothetical protein
MEADRTVLEEVLEVRSPAADFSCHPLLMRDVLKAIDRTLDVAAVVSQGTNVDKGSDSRAVRSLDYDFGIPRRRTGSNCFRHRAVVVGKSCAIEAE